MTKKKLFEDIKHNPSRIYRAPGDVLRDRRFADAERVEILRAWRESGEPVDLAEIDALIAEVEARLYAASNHAAE
ncbi:MAG: hypothetical protein V4601_07535 [Pseudomonadota bacterium]